MSNKITNKQAKEIVQVILQAQNIRYEDWLHDCHIQAIGENAAVLQNLLKKQKGIIKKEEK